MNIKLQKRNVKNLSLTKKMLDKNKTGQVAAAYGENTFTTLDFDKTCFCHTK